MATRFVGLLCLLSATLVLVPESAAQTYQGGLRGAVRDADGVVPGASVVLSHVETGFERTVVTNAAEEYAFPNLAPGVYHVRASLAGFKTFENREIRIGTQDFATIDLALHRLVRTLGIRRVSSQ